MTELTVRSAVRLESVGSIIVDAAVEHCSVVDEVHALVKHAELLSLIVGVAFPAAKLRPEMVTDVPFDDGTLKRFRYDTTGASKLKILRAVLTS